MNALTRVATAGLTILWIGPAARAPEPWRLPTAPLEEPTPQPEPNPPKIALIVAIGAYAPGTGWNSLATANDEKALRDSLKRQGFLDDHITTLSDAKATGANIVTAFREHLIKRAEPGAIAVFHYSGHGHRLTDNNGDEPDGYDEVLVPYDAPRNPPASYTGAKHVRDDQLNQLVGELRRAVGPSGDVVISLDSCFSGSAARSSLARAEARGDIVPIGPPQGGRRGRDTSGGFDEVGSGPAAPGGLSPYVMFSAARHDELAYETTGSDHRAIGSLTLGMSQALASAGPQTTYRALFDNVQRTMAARVVNTPQLEGLADREILGGKAVAQEPFFRIKSFDIPTRRARLAQGTLVGLFNGTLVSVHSPGTVTPQPAEALARGRVIDAGPTEAVVELDVLGEPAQIASGWLFVTDQSFGTLRANVRIEGAPGEQWVDALQQELKKARFVVIRDDAPDFIVTRTDGGISLHNATDGRLLLGPLPPANGDTAVRIAKRVKDATHNSYLRSMSAAAPGVDTSFEILPCELACNATGEKCDCVRDLDPAVVRPDGGALILAVNEGFRIRLRNRGEAVYLSVLDLEANGGISLLWPLFEHQGDDNRLLRGADFRVMQPWRITPPAGVEMFKLVASLQQIDFRPITSRGFIKDSARGRLDNLFIDAFAGARAEATLPVSTIHTQDITVRIVEKRTR